MTARDLISGSLRLIGAVASGDVPSADEANDALTILNQLIESWSTEELLIPNKVRESFPLVAGQKIYTMGPGGNFNTTRPQLIETAIIQVTTVTPVAELPIKILTKEQYAGIVVKDVQSTISTFLYAEGTYPLETINLWPVPLYVYNLILYSWKPLAQLATLDSAITLPPGYMRALRYALGIEIAPEWGRPVSADIMQLAIESKATIKRMNTKPVLLRVDEALTATPAVWNWMTGEPS
jgi:hypothetical protein